MLCCQLSSVDEDDTISLVLIIVIIIFTSLHSRSLRAFYKIKSSIKIWITIFRFIILIVFEGVHVDAVSVEDRWVRACSHCARHRTMPHRTMPCGIVRCRPVPCAVWTLLKSVMYGGSVMMTSAAMNYRHIGEWLGRHGSRRHTPRSADKRTSRPYWHSARQSNRSVTPVTWTHGDVYGQLCSMRTRQRLKPPFSTHRHQWRCGNGTGPTAPHTLYFNLAKNFLPKTQNLGLKIPHFAAISGKTKLLNTHNLLRRKFPAACDLWQVDLNDVVSSCVIPVFLCFV